MKTKIVLIGLVLASVVGTVYWVQFVRKSQEPKSLPVQTNTPVAAVSVEIPSTVAPVTNSEVAAAAQSLRNNSNRADASRNLTELRAQLDGMGTNAAGIVRQWFDSGADEATHLDFKLSPSGNLKEAPTLRTFLLDYLTRIDPKAAAAYAENIFRSSSSADEWALALRAYAIGNATEDGKTYLQQRIHEMFRNEEWKKNPSAGFLESFDVIVYTQDKELTPQLGKMIQEKDNRALAHAAYLTLDRLVQAAPADVLGQLQSQPELMDDHERTRADFFARADVRDVRQKTLLENYLLDAKRSNVELSQFAGVFPNANYMVSYNLLTQTTTPTGAELASRDREALATVQQWLADSRFAKLKPQLETIRTRLEQFVRQAGENTP